jgi:small nuclear ribonucleoprotein (snRNP)-like protein
LKNYFFYSKGTLLEIEEEFTRNFTNIGDLEPVKYETLMNVAKRIIELVQTNNAATLIGSLESTDILQNVVFDKVSCSTNVTLEKRLNMFPLFKSDEVRKPADEFRPLQKKDKKPELIPTDSTSKPKPNEPTTITKR